MEVFKEEKEMGVRAIWNSHLDMNPNYLCNILKKLETCLSAAASCEGDSSDPMGCSLVALFAFCSQMIKSDIDKFPA